MKEFKQGLFEFSKRGFRKKVTVENRRGFTLLEILVCVAIIGVLAAILLPSISLMRVKASQATCAGNMRQIGAAIFAYASDHDGYLPAGDHTIFWGDALVDEGLASTDALRKACPSTSRKLGYIGSLAYNYSVLGNNALPGTVGRVKTAAVSEPSKTAMVMDGHDLSGYGDFRDDPNNVLRNGGNIILWDKNFIRPDGAMFPLGHGTSVNILWCDGHVSSVAKQDFYDLEKIKEMFHPSVHQPAGF